MWKSSKNAPKLKSLSSVDQVTAFCWDAVMQNINFTAVHLLPLLGHRPPNVFQVSQLTGL